jgi:hypothetical protein
MSARARFLSMLVVTNALLVSTEADAAFCLPMTHHVNVGLATGTGTGCDYVYADIQTAINNVACPDTVISIAGGVTLANVALEINGKTNLTIVGLGAGTTCISPPPICDPDVGCGGGGGSGPPPAPNVTLQGNGAASVFYIHGNSSVTLQSLALTKGGGGAGGGIHFTGTGSLTLVNSSVYSNNATYGGGIQFNGSGGNATLTLSAGALVNSNTATSGGGIHLNGTARLLALSPYTEIGLNHAPGGPGGGIAVIGPARADLGSPGYDGLALVYGNDAANGGGIAVVDDGSGAGEPVLRTFAHDAAHPTAIDSNLATSNGGGVFIQGKADACLFALHMADNTAEDGAAIYHDSQVPNSSNYATDAGIYINGGSPSRLGSDCGPELVSDLGGTKDCKPYDTQCNAIIGSETKHANGTGSAGGVVTTTTGDVVASRFRIRESNTAYTLRGLNGATMLVDRCELTDNIISTYVVSTFAYTNHFHSCTITNNSLVGNFVFELYGTADLEDDIVYQPGRYTANYNNYYGGSFSAGYVMTNNTAGLPQNNPSIVQGVPVFVDAANGDYHLAPIAQMALDFGGAANTFDLDDAPPDVDLAGIPNTFGPADLGAYERQNLFYNCGTRDSFFCAGFDH